MTTFNKQQFIEEKKSKLHLLMGKVVGPRDAEFDRPLTEFLEQALNEAITKAVESVKEETLTAEHEQAEAQADAEAQAQAQAEFEAQQAEDEARYIDEQNSQGGEYF